jgi:spore germination cell wall hydrolase CwlJ-like protein
MTDAIAKSLEDNISKRMDGNIQDLMKQMMLKDIEPEDKDKEKAPSADDMGEGVGVQVSSDSEDFWLLATAAMFENSDSQGAADVAQAIYNRVAMPGDPWKVNNSIRKTILNPGQFQPVRQYGGYTAWGRIKTKEDAIRLSRSHGKTQEQLERVAAALLDKSKQQSARQFVGPRDSFRSVAYENANNHLADDTEVRRHGHVFGFEPRGATIGAFRQGKLSAAQVNANITGQVGYNDTHDGNRATSVGDGKFVQGNSGNSGGIHFHIGPGTQPGQVDTKYNADARSAAAKVIGHFLGKKSLYDGRRGVFYQSSSEVMAAQRAHSASGSQGGIDIQVGGAYDPGAKVPFPFAVSNMAYRPGGFGVSAKINGLNAFVAHGRYDERGRIAKQERGVNLYAFHGRYITKGGAYNLHEGEFVVHKYSVDLLGEPFIATINSVKNKTQLNQKVGSLIDHLSHIAGYEPGGMIPIEVEIDNGDDESQIIPVPMTKIIPVGGFGGGGDSYDYTQELYGRA